MGLLNRPVSGLDYTPTGRHLLVVPVEYPDPGASSQELPPVEKPAKDPLDDRPGGDEEAPRPHPGQGPYKHRELLTDERCSQTVLDSFANTDVGRMSGPPWQERKTRRLVRPQNGKRGNRRSFEGDGFLFLFTLSSVFLISFVFTTPDAFGGRGGEEATS